LKVRNDQNNPVGHQPLQKITEAIPSRVDFVVRHALHFLFFDFLNFLLYDIIIAADIQILLEECGEPLLPIPPCCLAYPLKRIGPADPALRPGRGTLGRIPLGQPPFLHRLRRPFQNLVRRLLRYYGAVRLPTRDELRYIRHPEDVIAMISPVKSSAS